MKTGEEMITLEWTLGFKDRGIGHGDFGVVTSEGTLVVECPNIVVAEHIINLHNKELVDGK